MKNVIKNFTLEDIIKRKLNYIINDEIFQYEDHERNGEIQACKEIISDLPLLSEKEFIDKYLGILKKLEKQFENPNKLSQKYVEENSYYNNLIVWFLRLIEPKYEYACHLDCD